MKPRGMNVGGEAAPPMLVGVMVLLDRSGSMKNIRDPMVAAFSQFLGEQRAIMADGMWLTLHQFDSNGYDTCYEKRPLADAGPAATRRDAAARRALHVRDGGACGHRRPSRRDGAPPAGHHHGWRGEPEHGALVERGARAVQGLESADCESVWLGTTSAVLEAQDNLPVMASPGATLTYGADAAGVNYMSAGFSAATATFRSGGSARSGLSDYTSGRPAPAEPATGSVDATSGLFEWIKRQGSATP